MSLLDPDRVPTTLDEALKMLDEWMPQQDREFITKLEDTPVDLMHFGLGMSLRNNWSLWEKDMPLVRWFNERGITQPDDMSGIILTSLWRRFLGEEIDLEGQIKSYQDFWTKSIGRPIP